MRIAIAREFVLFLRRPSGQTQLSASLSAQASEMKAIHELQVHFEEFGLKKRKEQMGILETAKPAIVICTRDRARATAFYRDTLGLTVAYEDTFAAVFNVGGVTLRISIVPDFTPHEHTILGFKVSDVAETVKALREKGATFNIYPGFPQDELGILTLPGGTVRVAWLKDPDGNVLSVTNA